jgi:simple sugar transport system substrate-binding protein
VRRAARLAAAALAVLLVAGCGAVKRPSEPAVPALPDIGGAAPSATGAPGAARTRIVVVTHGQASDPFWAVVRRGVDDAARQLGVSVSYEAPDSYDVVRMSRLIDAAVATHPDGLVVSLPDPAGLGPAVERALAAGIPVISINSGASAFRSLGISVHVGQLEYQAGFAVGERLARAHVKRVLCVIHEAGNVALTERCRGVEKALAETGATVHVLTVDLQDPGGVDRAIATALRRGRYDAMITLGGAVIAAPALAAISADGLTGRITYATFGVGQDVLRGVADGLIRFAVDQQPYLQGYLPVVLLADYHRYGLMPAKGTLIPTGPVFVTSGNAASVLELSARGLR